MAKQTFTTGQVLTAAQMTNLQQTALGGGSPVQKTANYVLTAADAGTTIQMNSAGTTTVTVNTGLFAAGDTVFIQNIGAGVSTITAGTATVTTAGSLALTQWEGGTLYFTSASAAIFFDYIQAGVSIPLTTKGDLFGFDTANARIPIGTNGQVLTADSTQALGLKWASAGTTFNGCRGYKTTNQSITSGAGTNITFNAESYDTNSYHSTTTNTDRFIAPTAGYYLITCAVLWSTNNTGDRILTIRKNAGATQMLKRTNGTYNNASGRTEMLTGILYLAANDYLVAEAYWDGTGSCSVVSDENNTYFEITNIGA